MRGPVSRSRSLLLPVFDGAFVGALRLESELAFGVANGVVGRPDTLAALPGRGAGGESRRRIFLVVSEGCAKA